MENVRSLGLAWPANRSQLRRRRGRVYKRVWASLLLIVGVLAASSSTAASAHVRAHGRGRHAHLALVPAHILTWSYDGAYATNMNATAAQIQQYLNVAESGKSNQDCPRGSDICRSVVYLNATQAWVNIATGSDAFGRPTGCTQLPTFMQQFGSDEGAYLHGYGSPYSGQLARVTNEVTSQAPNDTVAFYINDASPNYQAYINQAIAQCLDTWGGFMLDNTFPTISAMSSYEPELNIGGTPGTTGNGQLYNLNTLPPCSANCHGGAYVSSSTSQLAEMSTDSAFQQYHASFMDSLHYADSTPYPSYYNGLLNTDMTVLQNSQNSLGGIEENAVWCATCPMAGVDDYLNRFETVVDEATLVTGTTSRQMIIETGDTTSPTGSPELLQGRRAQLAAIWLGTDNSGRIGSWWNGENATTISPEWPEDGLVPMDPVQPVVPYDSNNPNTTGFSAYCVPGTGTPPNCVALREFNNCYQNQQPIGACAVLWNHTGVPQTVQPGWLHNTYRHVIDFCDGYPKCTGTSGGDVGSSTSGGSDGGPWGTGPGLLNTQETPLIPGTTKLLVPNTVQVKGTPASGDTVTVTVDSTPVTYTVTTGDTVNTIATHLASLVNADATLQNEVTASALGSSGMLWISPLTNTQYSVTASAVGTTTAAANQTFNDNDAMFITAQ